MIDRDEIDGRAAELQVRPTDIERDYVNGWLLSGIYGHSALANQLVLKGGNALRKGFFENTRYSKDLDFSAPGPVDKEQLRDHLQSVCAYVETNTGVIFLPERLEVVDKQRVSKHLEVLEAKAYFLDFYGERRTLPLRVFMDVTQYDRLLLPAVTRTLIHPYSDAGDCRGDVRCMALEEILASKLKCLLQRRHSADLFDYIRWVFFEDVPIDRLTLLRAFLRKTIYERAPGAALELLINLPFTGIKVFWERYITCPSTCAIAFDDGVSRFRAHLEELFGGLRSQTGFRLSFFPSGLREPILEAGRSQRLMSVRYDGIDRVVEPYALKYKERKDGGGGEYFYVHDRTGGSTGPGVKSFVAEKIAALTVLDETFEPRYEIEVAKAGEAAGDLRFRGSGGRRAFVPGFGIMRAYPRPRAHSTPKYRFRCPVCGKYFARTQHDGEISGHKSSKGSYQCAGSWGTYVGYR